MPSRYGTKRNQSHLPTLGERSAAARGAISIEIEVGHKKHWGFLELSKEQIRPSFPAHFEVTFWGDYFGKVFYNEGLICTLQSDQTVIDKVGESFKQRHKHLMKRGSFYCPYNVRKQFKNMSVKMTKPATRADFRRLW